MISSKNLAKAIYKLSENNDYTHKQKVESVLSFIQENKLEYLLVSVIKYLEYFKESKNNFELLTIEFGLEPTDKDIIHQIKDFIAKDIDIANTKYTVKKDLIGGFKASYKGTLYDASIQNQIQLLKQQLIQS